MKISAGGDLQVVDSAGTILWHAGSSHACTSCVLNFQNDGNLVLSGDDGKPYWGSNTWNGGALATLSSVPPYFTIRDGDFKMLWPVAGAAGPQALLAASRVGAVATSARSFLESLAVDSHVDQNGLSATTMLTMLNYLGIKTIRDGWKSDLGPTFTAMAQNGVHFDLGVGDPYAANSFAGAEAVSAMAPGALIAVEGPNEINNWSFVTDGQTSNHGWPNDAGALVQKFMTKLFSVTHANPKLGGVPVYNFTWGGTTDAEKYGMFDLGGQADFGNIHFYPNGQPYAKLQTALAASYHHVLPNRIVMTETGYDTANVSEKAQAILNINLYLGAFQQGVAKTYIYELYDEWQTYGLFRSAFAPKPAAVAIHNLTTILADSGTLASPGRLNYSVTGLPNTGHTLLLQKSNGKFELIVWNESPMSGNDVSVSPVAITVQFGQTVATVDVFDVAGGSTALQIIPNVPSVGFTLNASAVVLEITP